LDLAPINEAEEDLVQQSGIKIGANDGLETPLENQKKDIVTTLMGMNDEMKKFSGDIEERMDKLYKNVK